MPSAMMAFEILQHQVDILGCVVISGYDRQSGYNVASFGKILEIAKCSISDLTMDKLAFIAERANAAGSIVTGRYGSMRVMPENIEIEETVRIQRKS